MSKTLVSILAHRPVSIGGMETFARELSDATRATGLEKRVRVCRPSVPRGPTVPRPSQY